MARFARIGLEAALCACFLALSALLCAPSLMAGDGDRRDACRKAGEGLAVEGFVTGGCPGAARR